MYYEGTMTLWKNKREEKISITHEIDKVALTLHRLNNMWSFTGSQLSYACDNYLRPLKQGTEEEKIDALLDAYASLARTTIFYTSQGYILPTFWDKMFGEVGQQIVCRLPELLHPKKEKAFYNNLQKRFTRTWTLSPLPREPVV